MANKTLSTLMQRLAQGDQEALAEVYDRFAGLVHAIALRIVRNPTEAEEVVQAVFIQVWRQADRYDARRGTLEAWLYTLARTRALDCLRRRVSRREESRAAAPPMTIVPQTVERLAVTEALAAIPASQRQALQLAYYEGLTQAEIAERLGEPLGTVKTRIRAAMLHLREVLEPLQPLATGHPGSYAEAAR